MELDAGLSADEVYAEAQSEFKRVRADMYVIARQYWAACYPKEALPPDDESGRAATIRRVLGQIAQRHSTARTIVKDIRSGAAALEQGHPEQATTPLAKATDIVCELHATLDTQRAPELCQRLGDVYQFVMARLLQATTSREASFAREAERAFALIVEGFQGAVQQISHRQAATP